jgi:CRP/FNR family transcriptional regulator, anaerobic regulatory protein
MLQSEIIRKYLDNSFPFFEKELKELISKEATLKSYGSGDLLTNSRSIWLVVKGTVKVYREAHDGREFYIYMIGAGETCAISMLYQLTYLNRDLQIRAMEDTEVILIPPRLVNENFFKYSSWNTFSFETYRTRFEALLELVDTAMFRNLDERLELYLRNTVQKLGKRQLTITHQEIANDLNSSREVITRLLKKMEQKGMLKYDRHYLEWLG